MSVKTKNETKKIVSTPVKSKKKSTAISKKKPGRIKIESEKVKISE